MTTILMVCLGNICRSPLAHGILQSKLSESLFFVDSAGTSNYHIGSPPDQRSIAVAKANGIDISRQQARQFYVRDFDDFDLIYVMDDSNFRDIKSLARNANDVKKIQLILEASQTRTKVNVPDPYYLEDHAFEEVYNLLDRACSAIADKLKHNTI